VADVPAIAQDDAEGVVTFSHLFGDVVGLVTDAGVVVGPAGGEAVVCDGAAAEHGEIVAASGDVEAGRGDAARQVECLAKIAGRAGDVVGEVGMGDPPSGPVGGGEQAHFKKANAGKGCWAAIDVPGADAPINALPGAQASASVFDVGGGIGGDLAGIPEISLAGAGTGDDVVGGLHCAAAGVGELPEEARSQGINAEGIGGIFAFEIGGGLRVCHKAGHAIAVALQTSSAGKRQDP
jgi:hypothetical protein